MSNTTAHLTQTSVDIYGAARLGAASLVREVSAELSNITFVGVQVYDSSVIDHRIASANYWLSQLPGEPAVHARWLGYKQYELSNHLGNVTATLSDAKSTHFDGAVHYTPRITSLTDYYPFGAGMPGRSFSEGEYRYGFNGMEGDDEVAGDGNSYTAEFWQYDSRLGRRWNVDPVVKYHESSYAAFANNPIYLIDFSGADTTVYIFASTWKDEEEVTPEQMNEFKQEMEVVLSKNDLNLSVQIISEDMAEEMYKNGQFDPTDAVIRFQEYTHYRNDGDMGNSRINFDTYENYVTLIAIRQTFKKSKDVDISFEAIAATIAVHEVIHQLTERANHNVGLPTRGDEEGYKNHTLNLMMKGSLVNLTRSNVETWQKLLPFDSEFVQKYIQSFKSNSPCHCGFINYATRYRK